MKHNAEAIAYAPRFPYFLILLILIILLFFSPLKLIAVAEISVTDNEITIADDIPSFNTDLLPHENNLLYNSNGVYYLLSTDMDIGFYIKSDNYQYIKGVAQDETTNTNTVFYYDNVDNEWAIKATTDGFSLIYSTETYNNTYQYYSDILYCDTTIYYMIDASTIDYNSIYREADNLSSTDDETTIGGVFTKEQATELTNSLVIIRKILSFIIVVFFLFLLYKFIRIFL